MCVPPASSNTKLLISMPFELMFSFIPFLGWRWFRWKNSRSFQQCYPIFFAGIMFIGVNDILQCLQMRMNIIQGHLSTVQRTISVKSSNWRMISFRWFSFQSNSRLLGNFQAEKRAHHNALERKRRDHIKDSFTSLRESVPSLQGEKVVSIWWLKLIEIQWIDSFRILPRRLQFESPTSDST